MTPQPPPRASGPTWAIDTPRKEYAHVCYNKMSLIFKYFVVMNMALQKHCFVRNGSSSMIMQKMAFTSIITKCYDVQDLI